jgi:hypothetical protein
VSYIGATSMLQRQFRESKGATASCTLGSGVLHDQHFSSKYTPPPSVAAAGFASGLAVTGFGAGSACWTSLGKSLMLAPYNYTPWQVQWIFAVSGRRHLRVGVFDVGAPRMQPAATATPTRHRGQHTIATCPTATASRGC